MTMETEAQTVPRETPELLPAPPEGAPTSPDGVDVLADARAEALSWSPNTRRAYVAGWNHFTSWCIEHRCAGLPSAAADVGRYIEHLVEMEGKTLATARLRLAAIAAAHRLGGHPDPTARPLVKATMKRLGREYGKPRKQANGLTNERLAAVKATARIQRVHQGKRRRKETESQAAMRAAVDVALLEVMRDGLLRGSEASALHWGDLEFHTDGSGRLHVLRSKTDQTAEGGGALPGPRGRGRVAGHSAPGGSDRPGRQRLRTVGPTDLPEDQGGDQDGGLGRRVHWPLAPGGHGPGPERRRGGAAGADDRGKVGQPHHAGQVHGGPGRRQRGRHLVSPRRPPKMSLNVQLMQC